MKIIGLFGPPGAGKSTVRKILEEKNFPTLDADKVAHGLYQAGAVGAREVGFIFGSAFLNKEKLPAKIPTKITTFAKNFIPSKNKTPYAIIVKSTTRGIRNVFMFSLYLLFLIYIL